jgi:putative pyruvate formate lyase activating enzyme
MRRASAGILLSAVRTAGFSAVLSAASAYISLLRRRLGLSCSSSFRFFSSSKTLRLLCVQSRFFHTYIIPENTGYLNRFDFSALRLYNEPSEIGGLFMICTLCPRQCRADRAVRPGFCGLGEEMRIARIAPHLWEEPPVSGSRGTGAVFFSGCTLRCVYCQNGGISHTGDGRVFSPRELSDALKRLTDLGVHTLSFITATPFVPKILDTLELWRPPVPVVWNTSGYETVETVRMLEGAVDVWLPDLKHFSPRMGQLCAKAPDYFAAASAAIREMCRQAGPNRYDDDGILTRGVLVRHLILPGLTGESMKLLTWVKDNLPSGTPVSLMRQYVPCNGVSVPGLDRRVTEKEYRRVRNHMLALDLPGFLQEPDSADSGFIPAFNRPDSFV